ncbi:MAG: Hsp20/alpha crystallin family protein [Clostridium sp.]
MVINNPKNKFSLNKNKTNLTLLNKHSSNSKDNISINVLDNKSSYTISIYLKDLYKDNIVLSYINNFLVMDFTLKNPNNSSFNYKRTLYLKDIDITKVENLCLDSIIYITLPKSNKI